MVDKVPKEITQNKINARVIVLHSARRLKLLDINMKFREDSLNGFSRYRADTSVTDRQMPGEKTICLPTLKRGWGRDIITSVK